MRMLATLPSRRSLAHQFNRLTRELENAFAGSVSPAYPALNLWEDGDHFYLETELPGYQQADLEAYIVGEDQLVLKGKRQPTQHEKAVNHRQERTYGNFERTITLPKPVDGNQVEAKFINGVLNLKLGKAAQAKPKKIDIAIN